jgi:hypothetical protein
VPAWLENLRASGRLSDPVLRDDAVRAWIHDAVARLTSLRGRSDRTGAAAVGGKLRANAAFRAMCVVRSRAAGANGALLDGDGTVEVLTMPSISIRGGTDEIQRNLMAERFLGLPAETRDDLEVPWRESHRRSAGNKPNKQV